MNFFQKCVETVVYSMIIFQKCFETVVYSMISFQNYEETVVYSMFSKLVAVAAYCAMHRRRPSLFA